MQWIHVHSARKILPSMFAAGAFIHDRVNFAPSVAGAFLDAAKQFAFLALGELQIVIREPREFLFQFADGDVPVSSGNQCAHIFVFIFSVPHDCGDGNFPLQVACRPFRGQTFQQIGQFSEDLISGRKIIFSGICNLQPGL
jgi:hypothetical protein